MIEGEILIEKIGENISKEKRVIQELAALFTYYRNSDNEQEGKMISSQINSLKSSLGKIGGQVINDIEKVSLFKPLHPKNEKQEGVDQSTQQIQKQSQSKKRQPAQQQTQQSTKQPKPKKLPTTSSSFSGSGKKPEKLKPSSLEKLALKRIKKQKKKKKTEVKEKKPSKYAKISSSFFYNFSMSLINKRKFNSLKRDLVRANIKFVPATYISMIFFSTLLAFILGLFITILLLFFSFSFSPPFITMADEGFGIRFLKFFWVFLVLPGLTFLFAYFYPSLERKSLERRINRELPFAVIHMSSISSSMIEPSKIFNIIINTKEYPHLEKEFIKLQNEINIYGYDLVTALRNRSFNSPSRKLSELFNGLAITITSGGDLPGFFEKRSQSLLFEHRLDMEKESKAAETYMDIYISVVIAAPMILMLLLIMMRITGLGISLSTSTITLIMILGITLVNILFLTFLQLKQSEK